MHHLSVNVTKWLNVGLFESVIFGRGDRFEFDYMVPIILYRAIERANGSPDNENLGLNFKAIVLKHVQLYGQFFLDEFKSAEFFGNKGWWGNKWALQLGGKYYDAFTIKNLDVQGEVNIVRPYTYTHSDSIANYTHYNQPLAHPLGADLKEVIGTIRYQPVKNLYLDVMGTYYIQGIDSAGTNYGSNIFLDYDTRAQEYGVKVINGVRTQCAIATANISYQLRPNLFIDAGYEYRRQSYGGYMPTATTNWVYGGVRMNAPRRRYDGM